MANGPNGADDRLTQTARITQVDWLISFLRGGGLILTRNVTFSISGFNAQSISVDKAADKILNTSCSDHHRHDQRDDWCPVASLSFHDVSRADFSPGRNRINFVQFVQLMPLGSSFLGSSFMT